ncbi:molybdopterin converting factor subunit 1 [Paenibacillus anaericanus]|uniref:Molybdopterin synthase sulfur carrier subunit n=1 Tax=Paenibacillus anaericanus TaxID=170367 RepID=A0A3S1DVM3_9BACL|nr:molybdopterin converting factor subunit 1 [Paenibacillus anaericanus]RUT46245.1 molybdopterin converting factor subunit 1 [Paenibacillus anaericanus]
MEIIIALFAGLADRIGTSRLTFTTTEASVTVDQLKEILTENYPAAASLIAVSFVAVNQEYARGEVLITSTDEVALIPPVSGG